MQQKNKQNRPENSLSSDTLQNHESRPTANSLRARPVNYERDGLNRQTKKNLEWP